MNNIITLASHHARIFFKKFLLNFVKFKYYFLYNVIIIDLRTFLRRNYKKIVIFINIMNLSFILTIHNKIRQQKMHVDNDRANNYMNKFYFQLLFLSRDRIQKLNINILLFILHV